MALSLEAKVGEGLIEAMEATMNVLTVVSKEEEVEAEEWLEQEEEEGITQVAEATWDVVTVRDGMKQLELMDGSLSCMWILVSTSTGCFV